MVDMFWKGLIVKSKELSKWLKVAHKHPERFFLVVSLTAGLGFLVLTPPFQNPDEQVHFYRAYQISTLRMSAESNYINGKVDELGGYLPRSLKQTYTINNIGRYGSELRVSSNDRYRLGAIKESLKIPLDKDSVEWHGFSSSAIYSPVSYLPQAIGIGLGSLLNLPPILLLYLGRLFGLLFFVTCLYLALKLLPTKKWAFAILFTLPVVVSQSAAVTADTITTVSIGILVALILYARTTKQLSNKQLGVLAGAVVTATLSKQVFLLVIPLLLVIPQSVFRSKYRKYLFISAVGIASLLSYFAWSALGNVSEGMSLTVYAGGGADMTGQVNYLVNNIFNIPHIFYNTFLTADYGSGIFWSLAGNFGWLSAPLSFPGMLLVYVLLITLFFTSYEKTNTRGWWVFNSVFILVAALLFGAIGISLYIAHTVVGGAAIAGLQGRYYVPILIILLAVMNPYILLIKKTQYIKVLRMLSVSVLVISLATVLMRFWVEPTLW